MALGKTRYYDLLGVSFDAEETSIRKAYYKTALKYHPDKNKTPGAEETFKEINKAYQVLSDPKLRAAYDKNGKPMARKNYVDTEDDPVTFFAKMFGGESFVAYVGETALAKMVNKIIKGTEMGGRMNAGSSNLATLAIAYIPHFGLWPESTTGTLAKQLIEKLQPFVNANHPGDKNDPNTRAFEKKMRKEAEKMRLESFGVELLHTIGSVYKEKATSFLGPNANKSSPLSGFLSLAMGALDIVDSGINVYKTMRESEKPEAQGEAPRNEEMFGEIMLVTWRVTRLECVRILQKVCDRILGDPGASESVLSNRAKGLLLLGNIFESMRPDKSDSERRELEQLVAKAASARFRH